MRLGEPRFKQNLYEKQEQGEITVYIPKRINQENLSIGLNRFLGLPYLVIRGWRPIGI
ncbi:hypothetical protein skT53_15290 [Effusibacillus dendaii]|uniref:Uncharacterized protein n=1 Tax=Effusibacillus dendaii TaxID=2743772 RepID=A0A7I8D8U0_9BACL|nr:hypothetical protein skT53_15290 [Effusibacillus dendaii]